MKPYHSSRGQVYPLFGVMLTVLIGISALSVDMGYYRYQQRVQQAATDSAAIAAAQANFYNSTNSANAQNAAQDDAKENGYDTAGGNVTVTALPHTDSGNCASGCIQATITKTYPVFFGSIFRGFAKNGGRPIKTTAAARMEAVAGACLTSLGQVSSTATTKNGNGQGITGADCGIADANCTTVNSNGNKLDVGSWSENGACGATNKCAIKTGTCTVGLPPIDPCSVTPQCQTLEKATAAELNLSSLTTSPTCQVAAPTTKSPFQGGCYGTQTFSGTVKPGLYVITGTATFSSVTATGVTFYFAKGATWGGSFTLSAPTIGSGDYSVYGAGEEGIVMYQAPSSTIIPISLNSDISVTGLAYQPAVGLTSNGHSITVVGNFAASYFTLNGNGSGGGIFLTPGTGTESAGPEVAALAE